MKPKTLQLSDLPTSLDLQKYSACSTFGIADWYTNLMHRTLRRNTAARYRHEMFDELRRGADHFIENPIMPVLPLSEGDGYQKSVFRSQVRDVSAGEVFSGRSDISLFLDRSEKFRAAFDVLDRELLGDPAMEGAKDALGALNDPAWRMFGELGVDIQGEVQVNVDLFASEEKLLDDFRSWLRSTRQALNIPSIQRRFAKPDFDRWHQNRILAYLDLSFWADVNGLRLTNQLLGVALFPEEYNIGLADRIRKVVMPMALAAASPSYLEALLSQAFEEAERKSL